MTEQWQELKETITEMRDNDGTSTQQEVCKFLVNYMDVLEKQMQEPKTGYWIITYPFGASNPIYECPYCKASNSSVFKKFCPNCGEKMFEPQESEDKE